MEYIKITSVSQFVSEIEKIPQLAPYVPAFSEKTLFRGQSQHYPLKPSLDRKPSELWGNSWSIVEDQIIHEAQSRYPLVFHDTDYPVILLAKLQQYGIPTRMLDLTANPLVALYFACCKHEENDGEVYALEGRLSSAYNPYANAVADTYRLTENHFLPLETYYFRVIKNKYALNIIQQEGEILPENINHFVNYIRRPLFIEVGSVCERQKNQDGYFLLFPNKIEDKRIFPDLVEVNEDAGMIYKKYIIDAASKGLILKQLKTLGISEETLFPDDIDKVLQCIVARYKERYELSATAVDSIQ